MPFRPILLGVLAAAPLFSQLTATPKTDPQPGTGEPAWFQLKETMEQVRRILGQPPFLAAFGKDFESWQYQIGNIDHEDYSHVLVFSKSTRTLLSVVRNYDVEGNVDVLFPPDQTEICHYPERAHPTFSARVRRLSGGRILMAMGTSKLGQVTGQMVLIRESELRVFYPWVHVQIRSAPN